MSLPDAATQTAVNFADSVLQLVWFAAELQLPYPSILQLLQAYGADASGITIFNQLWDAVAANGFVSVRT